MVCGVWNCVCSFKRAFETTWHCWSLLICWFSRSKAAYRLSRNYCFRPTVTAKRSGGFSYSIKVPTACTVDWFFMKALMKKHKQWELVTKYQSRTNNSISSNPWKIRYRLQISMIRYQQHWMTVHCIIYYQSLNIMNHLTIISSNHIEI